MIDIGSAVGYLMLDTSGFQKGFNSALQDLQIFESKTATTKDKLKGLGSAMNSVGSQLSKKVTLPIVALGTAAVKMSSNFNQAMSGVKAISGATGDEFEALREKALELGAATAFSSQEVAAGMIEMAKAGWSSQQIIDGMGGVLDSAAASGESLATVSTIVADAITSFGLAAADSTRVADLMAQAANSGTIDIVDIGESMKYAAPLAKALGFSIEDVTTAIAAMSTAGIKGSQAGTSLRTMFSGMSSDIKFVGDGFEDLKVAVRDSDGQMRSLNDIVSDMRFVFSKMTQAQKVQNAENIAGKNGMSGLLSIMTMTEKEYDKLAATMYESQGAADETARTMQDNLAMAVEQLGGAFETLAIRIGDVMTPMIRSLVEWLTGVVEKLGQLDPEILRVVTIVAGLTAALGPLLLIGAKVITLIAEAKTAMSTLGIAAGALTGPFGIAIAVVTAFAAAWATNFGGIRDVTGEIIGAIGDMLKTWFDSLKTLWDSNFLGIRTTLTLFFEAIEAIFSGGFTIIQGLVKVFTGMMTLDWNTMCEGLKDLVDGVIKLIKGMFEAFNKWTGGLLGKIVNTVKEKVKSIISFVENAIAKLAELASASAGVQASKGKDSSGLGKTKSKVKGYANGLEYVPYDGFPAILHKGERVLTKTEANDYNQGKSGATYQFTFNSPQELSPAEQTRQFKKAMNQILFNM
nr:MAG TPA: minor tail protein [Caudoviricetes sp.]